MAYTTWNFLTEWDISEQDDPYGNENAYEVMIMDDCTGKKMMGVVWAESEDLLRDDLVDVMDDCEFIEAIYKINPYTY